MSVIVGIAVWIASGSFFYGMAAWGITLVIGSISIKINKKDKE